MKRLRCNDIEGPELAVAEDAKLKRVYGAGDPAQGVSRSLVNNAGL